MKCDPGWSAPSIDYTIFELERRGIQNLILFLVLILDLNLNGFPEPNWVCLNAWVQRPIMPTARQRQNPSLFLLHMLLLCLNNSILRKLGLERLQYCQKQLVGFAPERYFVYESSTKASGFCSAIRNKAMAGPLGLRRP